MISKRASHRRRFATGLFVGLAVGLLILSSVLVRSRADESRFLSERSGIIAVLSLAEVVHEAGVGGDEVRHAVTEFARQNPSIRMIRVVRGVTLEASTAPGDTGEKAAPRRLAREEKPVYDLGQRLRAAVQTNREEEVARKNEIDIQTASSGGLLLAAPVEVDDAVVGFVQLETAPAAPPPGVRWWLPVVALLIPFSLFLLLCQWIGERRLILGVVASTLLVAILFGYGARIRQTLFEDRRATEKTIASLLRQQEERLHSILAALAIELKSPPQISHWDADLYRQPRGLISDSGTIQEARLSVELQYTRQQLREWDAGVTFLSLALLAFFGFGAASLLGLTLVRHRQAYLYTTPAMIGMIVLVFFPFLYGITLSFTGASLYNTDKSILEIWTGLRNYKEILGDFAIIKRTLGGVVPNFTNFYYTFFFTVIWTITNVSIGVGVGLLLALILNTKGLAMRPLYRVLLIFPWAMPNYITALIWKGMFHQQFGVINQVIQLFGGEPVTWFEKPVTSFLTALATNGWLSFPFMMVVSLGALQSISADLYEAARVDGATRWQQFRSITLPSLRPALIPAIILSVVWTFNMFNIIFLVTAGLPAGSTEILITQAYKIAFEQYRYGYAAAYSTVIFIILLVYGVFQNRITRATEAIAG